jgi:hypothetical protein
MFSMMNLCNPFQLIIVKLQQRQQLTHIYVFYLAMYNLVGLLLHVILLILSVANIFHREIIFLVCMVYCFYVQIMIFLV